MLTEIEKKQQQQQPLPPFIIIISLFWKHKQSENTEKQYEQ